MIPFPILYVNLLSDLSRVCGGDLAYEATQKQRRMETNMRAQREEVQLLEEGGVDSEDITIERCKYQAQLDEYKAFCDYFGFLEQRERIYYDLNGRISPSQATYKEWKIAEVNKNIVTIDNRKISEFCLKPGAKHADEFFSVGYTNSVSDQKRLRRNLLGQYDRSKIETTEVKKKNITGVVVDVTRQGERQCFVVEADNRGKIEGGIGGESDYAILDCMSEELEHI